MEVAVRIDRLQVKDYIGVIMGLYRGSLQGCLEALTEKVESGLLHADVRFHSEDDHVLKSRGLS